MDTEFPRRLPTVRNNANSSSNSSSSNVSTNTSSANDAKFQQDSLKILNEVLKTLKNTTENVSKIFNTTQKKSTKVKKEERGNFTEQFITLYKSTITTLKNTVDAVRETKLGKGAEWINKKLSSGIESIQQSWDRGIERLQNSVDNVASGVGGAFSKVFGSGMFGNFLGNIIKKAITFGVSKLLLGMILQNPLKSIAGAAVVAGIYFIVKYAKEIWEGIKWLGSALDQLADALLVKFGIREKSKYEAAREDLASDAGVSKQDVLDYFGDTVAGRAEAKKAWEKASEDAIYRKQLADEIKEFGNWNRKMSVNPDTIRNASASQKTIQYIQSFSTTNNYSGQDYLPNGDIALASADSMSNMNMTPIMFNNSTNTTNVVNSGWVKNVSDIAPTAQMSKIPANFYN